MEHETGSLQRGKRADLVVLSGDPRSVAAEHLPDLRIERTYVAGDLAFKAPMPMPHRSSSASAAI